MSNLLYIENILGKGINMETVDTYMYMIPYSFIYGAIAFVIIVLGMVILKLARKRKNR